MGTHHRCAHVRAELGVYITGAIGPSDRAAVDQHLAACQRCREELASLAGLPALLHRIPDGRLILDADPAVQQIPAVRPEALLRQASRRRRRHRVLAAAAAAALIAPTAAVSAAVHGRPQPRVQAAVWEATVQASDPATRAWALIRYAPRRWGTDIQVRIAGVPRGTLCQLWVSGADGRRIPAGSWTVATSRPTLWYPASASPAAASLRSFEITTSQGSMLVTIPAAT